MIRAGKVLRADAWSDVATDEVVLGYDDRHRRRVLMTGVRGLEFLLDLPEATLLRDGDGLVLGDGRIVRVRAAPEPVAEIGAPSAEALTRIAWHLGNRHLPTEIAGGRLRIRRDPVIEDMVAGLGGTVTLAEAPFNPEGGAYAGADPHGRAHPDHGHDHEHGNDHSHPHDH